MCGKLKFWKKLRKEFVNSLRVFLNCEGLVLIKILLVTIKSIRRRVYFITRDHNKQATDFPQWMNKSFVTGLLDPLPSNYVVAMPFYDTHRDVCVGYQSFSTSLIRKLIIILDFFRSHWDGMVANVTVCSVR